MRTVIDVLALPGIEQSIGRGCDQRQLQSSLRVLFRELLFRQTFGNPKRRPPNHRETVFLGAHSQPTKIFEAQTASGGVFFGGHVT